jgi:hypothetical protein
MDEGGRGSGDGGTASRWRGDGREDAVTRLERSPLPLFPMWMTPGVTRALAQREMTHRHFS